MCTVRILNRWLTEAAGRQSLKVKQSCLLKGSCIVLIVGYLQVRHHVGIPGVGLAAANAGVCEVLFGLPGEERVQVTCGQGLLNVRWDRLLLISHIWIKLRA